MSTIKINIVSSSEEIYSGEGTMVYATGSLGEIGIAPGHTPLLTGLAAGQVRVVNGEKEEAFFSEENFKLTYTPFIIIATVNALKEMPEMNSSLDGDSIIYHNSINMGIAVSVDGVLMVPSIFNCDEKNL